MLEERRFPLSDLRLFASPRSEGVTVRACGAERAVRSINDSALDDVDIAFFAAGAPTSRRHAPGVAQRGGVAVDKSSAFRMAPDVPLVVPEVNAAALQAHCGIVANPNCMAIPLSIVLAPLHAAFGLRQVTLATYQAASGAGRDLVAELVAQEGDEAAGRAPEARVYPHVLHRNVVPGGWAMHGDDTDEELKIAAETRRVLDMPELAVSVTSVRVPVMIGHSAAVFVELARPATRDEARDVLSTASGVRVVDDTSEQRYPTPRNVAGTDDVQVGRIRVDHGRRDGLALFFSADNLRRGAATNAVQVAELLLGG